VMFTRLFDRLPDLRVPDQPVSWHDSAASRSLHSLRVAYDASTG
jgi:hypothetical protein